MYLRLSKALSSLLLLTVIFTSTAAIAAIQDVSPGTPFTPLEPTREQAVTTQQILNNLLRGHYELQRLDDRLSSKIFDLYLEDLDGTRSYLLAGDVQSFEKYRKQFDDVLMRENAPWATSTIELDDLWRKRLKNSILNLTMSGKDHKAAIELLQKRYQNQLNRIHQNKPEDAYQAVMNAVTRALIPIPSIFLPVTPRISTSI